MSLVGKKVLIKFNPASWPIAQATYTYEGHDAGGYWVRRSDGVQRYFQREDVVEIIPVEEEVGEGNF